MKKIKSFFVLLSVSVLVISCDLNETISSNEDFTKNFGNAVTRDFLGQVVDENNYQFKMLL